MQAFYGSWCILCGKIRLNAFKVISTFGFTGLVVTMGVTWEEERGPNAPPISLLSKKSHAFIPLLCSL